MVKLGDYLVEFWKDVERTKTLTFHYSRLVDGDKSKREDVLTGWVAFMNRDGLIGKCVEKRRVIEYREVQGGKGKKG